MAIKKLTLDQLEPADDNLRQEYTDIEALAASIFEMGLLEALVVTQGSDAKKYKVVAGHRRRLAIKHLIDTNVLPGDHMIPCEYKPNITDEDRRAMMLVENMQRVDLNPVDQYEGMRALATEHNWTAAQISERLGLSLPLVKARLSWAKLPQQTLERVRLGDMKIETANDLASLPVDTIDELTKKNGKADAYEIDQRKRKAKADKEREAWIRKAEKAGHIVINREAYDRIMSTGVAELDGIEAVAKQMILDMPETDTHKLAFCRLRSMMGEDVSLDNEFLMTPRVIRLFISEHSGVFSAEAVYLEEIDTTDKRSQYDKDVDEINEANQQLEEDYRDAVALARIAWLNDSKSSELIAKSMTHILKHNMGYQVRAIAEMLGLDEPTEHGVMEYASKSVSNLARAFAAYAMKSWPPMVVEVDVPAPVLLDTPDPADYDEDGNPFTSPSIGAA